LRAAGLNVRLHGEHVPANASDEEWLSRIGPKGWIVLTKDKMIRRRILEREALIAAGVRAFVLTAGNLRGSEMAEIFLKNLSKIESLARTTPAPFIAKVTRDNVVEIYDLRR
jgi:hypothetical protein